MRGSKRCGFHTRKLLAEVYTLESEENVWRQIDWNSENSVTDFLSFQSLVQLRHCFVKGVLMLDFELGTQSFSALCTAVACEMSKKFKTNERKLAAILDALSNSQKHLPEPGDKSHEGRKPTRKIFSHNKGSADSETAQIFASALPQLEKVRFTMVRLGNTLEKVRFMFVLFGPPSANVDYKTMGCTIANIITKQNFQELMYKAIDRQDLISGLDKFLNEGIFIPPIRDEITVAQIQIALDRQQRSTSAADSNMPAEEYFSQFQDTLRNPLERSGKLFGGVMADLRGRVPYYLSDFTDAFTWRTICSIAFIFFATFAPAITFGGLISSYTDHSMGIMETLMAQSVCGLIWGFLSAQPLLIVSATGPMLIFEKSLFDICNSLELDFLTIRIWIALWMLIIAFLVAMFEGSALLRYVARFTEEIISTLIAAIFIILSIEFVTEIFNEDPVRNLMFYWNNFEYCANSSNLTHFDSSLAEYQRVWEKIHFEEHCFTHNQPDTSLLSIILMFGTFSVAYLLKLLRSSRFLPSMVRQALGDMGMLISIALIALLKYVVFDQVYISFLNIPLTFDFTSAAKRNHSILVPFLLPDHKWWGYLVGIVPAFLLFILLFVETQITELLLLKKDRGLVKGGGVHWDMLLLACLTLLCSAFGLPWMCAAASQSLAHASSLTVFKPTDPGQKPEIEKVIEQRVTAIVVSVMLGASLFAGGVLRFVPVPVLFGVLFYLGIMGLQGMQFVRRVVLLLVPAHNFPDTVYCQKVKPKRMHVFTVIQLLCASTVYAVKSFQSAMAFPVVLLLTCLLRHKVLPLFFSTEELHALDGQDEEDEGDKIVNEMFSALKF